MNPIERQQPWKKAKLSEIATIERVSVQPGGIGNGTRYVGLEHVSSEGAILEPPTVNLGDLASSKFAFGPDHILYGKLRPYLSKIARPDFSGVCSTDILPIRPGPAIDRGYLYYCLRQPELIQLATSRCSGANLPRLNPAILSNFQISFPPLEEQRRIADILDQADALRRKRRESLALTSSLIPSIFHSMFGDPGTNSKGWPIARLDEISSTRLGKMLDSKRQTGAHIRPYLRNMNVQWGRLDLAELAKMDFDERDRAEFKLEVGDVLVCEGGEVGRTAIWNGEIPECYFQKALHRVRLNPARVLPEFFLSLMRVLASSGQLAGLTSQATIAHLTGVKLRTLRVVVPPISAQRDFAARVAEVRALEDKQRASLREFDALFNSLLHETFSSSPPST